MDRFKINSNEIVPDSSESSKYLALTRIAKAVKLHFCKSEYYKDWDFGMCEVQQSGENKYDVRFEGRKLILPNIRHMISFTLFGEWDHSYPEMDCFNIRWDGYYSIDEYKVCGSHHLSYLDVKDPDSRFDSFSNDTIEAKLLKEMLEYSKVMKEHHEHIESIKRLYYRGH